MDVGDFRICQEQAGSKLSKLEKIIFLPEKRKIHIQMSIYWGVNCEDKYRILPWEGPFSPKQAIYIWFDFRLKES